MKTLTGLLVFGVLFLVTACSSAPEGESPEPVAIREPVEGKPVYRYLAWLQGDYQNGYRASRKQVNDRLNALKGVAPSDKEKYLEYLSLLDATGQKKSAGKAILDFLRVYPNEKRAAFLLAVHHLRAGKTSLARHFFERLEKDGEYAWKSLVYNNLGMIALQEGKRYQAIAKFEQATKTEPAIAAPFVNLGALYLQSQSYADAEQAFSRAQALDGDFEDAVLGRGAALEGLGKFAEAHQVYSSFIGGHPKAVSVLYNDSIILGKRLNQKAKAAQQLLLYVQRGGKETARAQELIQKWR